MSNMLKRKRTGGSIPTSFTAFLWGAIGDDFSSLQQLIQRKHAEDFHSNISINLVLEELFRYLFLLTDSVDNNEIQVSPSEIVDKALHCLLLDPILYHRVCDELLSLAGFDLSVRSLRVLPHNPLGGDDQSARDKSYQNTFEKYGEKFDCDPPALIWEQPETKEDVEHLLIREEYIFPPFEPTPENEPTNHIFVDMINFSKNTKTKTSYVIGSVTETFVNVMWRVNQQEGYPLKVQRLLFAGVGLPPGGMLTEYNLNRDNVSLTLLVMDNNKKENFKTKRLKVKVPPYIKNHEQMDYAQFLKARNGLHFRHYGMLDDDEQIIPTPDDEPSYRIFIKSSHDCRLSNFELIVGSVTETVHNLMLRIRDKDGCPVERQNIVFHAENTNNDPFHWKKGRIDKEPNKTLSECGITADSVVCVLPTLCGC